jgi:hypothetical protein
MKRQRGSEDNRSFPKACFNWYFLQEDTYPFLFTIKVRGKSDPAQGLYSFLNAENKYPRLHVEIQAAPGTWQNQREKPAYTWR